jgi:hypothetical protein
MLPRIVSSAALRTAVASTCRRAPVIMVRRTPNVLPLARRLPTRSYVSSTKPTRADYVNMVQDYGKV